MGGVDRRFAIGWAVLAMLTGAVVAAAVESVRAAPGPTVSAVLGGAPQLGGSVIYQDDIVQATAVLPGLFLTDDQATALGLTIVANGFDNLDPPRPTNVFRYPLPGQTPRSVLVSEFLAGGFLVGRAQSYIRTGRQGKLGTVVWAFQSEAGAQRSFRAMRDLSGRHWVPSDFAPIAAVSADAGLGLSDLLWVRGRLLLRATYAVPDDDLASVSALRDTVAAIFDERSVVAARPPGAVVGVAESAGDAVDTRTLAGRLAALEVPDLELPGGLNTDPRHVTGGAVFTDPARGSGVSTPLTEALERAGFLGGHEQVVSIAGQPRSRFALYAWAFPTQADAEEALAAVAATYPAGRRLPSSLFTGAQLFRGPNGDNYTDLFWVHGGVLLQAGLYSNVEVPQKPSVRDGLARLLDQRAVAAFGS